MAQAIKQYVTFQDYLDFDEASENTKYEYFQGYIRAMSGGSPNHSQIKANMVTAFNLALGTRPCIVFDSDLKVYIEAFDYGTHPDITVVCGEKIYTATRPKALTNPVLLVEVLSPSTAMLDRTRKFDRYKGLPSFQDYLLVEQNEVKVTYYHRVGPRQWFLQEYIEQDETIELQSLGVSITVEQIYRNVIFESQPADTELTETEE